MSSVVAQQHLIDSAVFDIGFNCEESAFAMQSGLSDFINKELMAVIKETFDELADPKRVVQIAKLECDLGRIALSDYRYELPRRLKEKLHDALAGLKAPEVDTALDDQQALSNQQRTSDMLFYFLRHGYLPWYARRQEATSIDEWIESVIDQNPEGLMQLLTDSIAQQSILERLVNQSRPQTLIKLVTYLNQIGSSPEITQLLSTLQPLGMSETASNAIWLTLLTVLLNLKTGRFTQAKTRRYLSERLPAQWQAELKLTATPQRDTVDDELKWSELLAQALERAHFPLIAPQWQVLVKDRPETIRQALRRLAYRPIIRRAIAQRFPEEVLHDFIAVMVPTEQSFVGSVLKQPELFRHEHKVDESDTKTVLWSATLGYLVEQRGSRFNKRSFLAALLSQMAVANRISYAQMLSELTQHVVNLAKHSPLVRELTSLLYELGSEVEQDEISKQDQTDSPAVREYQAYTQLSAELGLTSAQSVMDVVTAITQLQTDAPWLLLRLIEELRATGASLVNKLQRLSGVQRHRLLSVLTSINDRPEFLRAIEQWAAKCEKSDAFYLAVLEALIKDELVDFEAITQQLDSYAIQSEGEYFKRTAEQPSGDAPAKIIQTVYNYLQGHGTPTYANSGMLIADWRQLIAHQPQVVRQHLPQIIVEPKLRQRLVTELDEQLLSKSLVLLGVQEQARMQRCAELIRQAIGSLRGFASVASVGRLQWQFMYRYVSEYGVVFDERRFVELCIEQLAKQIKTSATSQFRAELAAGLIANALPSTRAVAARIAEYLRSSVPAKQARVAQTKSQPAQSSKETDTVDEPLPLEDIHIQNAGMVLAAPYLPRLLGMMNLTDANRFMDREAAERAAHLLQYMIDERSDAPEYQLVLNKLLCGIRPGKPIVRAIDIETSEQQQIEGLLHGMIQNWRAIGNTSVAGLRESFFQRQGRLQLKNDAWHLRVETKAFDVLLDSLPWSFSTIKYPWMERVIYVEWR